MFITIEGIEGAGKSTIVALIAERLRMRNKQICVTHEPGGCALGRKLRKMLLDPAEGPIDRYTEFYLFLADRAQHVAEVIRPALEAGQIVICDRYGDSTFAYQGYGRGIEWDHVIDCCYCSEAYEDPDITLYLDLPVEMALERVARRKTQNMADPAESRFDNETKEFLERVREGFLARAQCQQIRFVTIDASRPINAVLEDCMEKINKLLDYYDRKNLHVNEE